MSLANDLRSLPAKSGGSRMALEPAWSPSIPVRVLRRRGPGMGRSPGVPGSAVTLGASPHRQDPPCVPRQPARLPPRHPPRHSLRGSPEPSLQVRAVCTAVLWGLSCRMRKMIHLLKSGRFVLIEAHLLPRPTGVPWGPSVTSEARRRGDGRWGRSHLDRGSCLRPPWALISLLHQEPAPTLGRNHQFSRKQARLVQA